jgi:phosphohistidine phosphatase
MKTLLILRHGKSSWKNSDEFQDHDRPLNNRGKRDAPRIGRLIKTENLIPDHIMSSTAKRARKTARAATQEFEYQGEIDETGALYHAEADEYIEALRHLSDDYQRVMVVGHNPGLEDLIELLTGRVEVMPTCGLAVVELPIEQWSSLNGKVKGKLINIWRPKALPPEVDEEQPPAVESMPEEQIPAVSSEADGSTTDQIQGADQ